MKEKKIFFQAPSYRQAFTPAATLAFLWGIGMENPNGNVLLATAAMTLFTCVAAYGELHSTLTGFVLMAISIGAEVVRMALTQKLFTGKVRFTVVESLYYIGPVK